MEVSGTPGAVERLEKAARAAQVGFPHDPPAQQEAFRLAVRAFGRRMGEMRGAVAAWAEDRRVLDDAS